MVVCRVGHVHIIITVWSTTVMTEDLELGGGGVYCGARLCESDIAARQRLRVNVFAQ